MCKHHTVCTRSSQIRAGGRVFCLRNPFAGIGGGLDLQEIRVGGGGEVGKKSSHLSGAGKAVVQFWTPVTQHHPRRRMFRDGGPELDKED